MSRGLALAVDGGNSKTDLALVGADGRVLGAARGPHSSPHDLGLDGAVAVLEDLLFEAAAHAGLRRGDGELVDVGALLLAGVDFPVEERELSERVDGLGWAQRILVANDTFAILRAGTEQGWGVAVTCGAGINCVGVAPDGRHARFPALGELTGDWGGGYDVGLAAQSAAARSEDGRGPATSLERLVPAHFGLETPAELAEAIHRGRIPQRRLSQLAPLVFAAAAEDAVAAGLVDRLAEEIVSMAGAALRRLGLDADPVEVLLGGGLLRAGDARLLGAVERGLHEVAAGATVQVTDEPPIVGAALLALDALDASAEAKARVRRELPAAIEIEPAAVVP
jgi:N-acetylglucosamine kinase-like BadF-type ATPase